MVKRMLIDATHAEETRVVVLNGSRLEDFDVETSTKKQLKGNIYLAKIVRVEPSLQAAFVDYGGGRHGFLAFNEIHPDYYQIPVADRQALIAEHRAAMRASGAAASADFDDADSDEPRGRGRGRDRSQHHEPSGEAGDAAHAEGAESAAAHDGAHEGEAFEASEIEAHEHTEHDEGSEPSAEHGDGDGEETLSHSAEDDDHDHAHEHDPEHDHSHEDGHTHEDGHDHTHGDEHGEEHGPEVAPASTEEHGDHSDGVPHTVAAAAPVVQIAAPIETTELGGGDEIEEVEEAARRRHRPLRHYKIQEVIKRRQIVLVQVVKEERGTKGAALTTYLSLAGRYCVLMPNTARGGGVSRKITNAADRKRLKTIVNELEIPDGMAVIIRTAGSERTKPEIKRDYEYLLRLWDSVRDLTLQSTAPALVYEEANLIKRSIRDLYARDIDEILVEGDEGYRLAKDFMRMLTPSHAKKVQLYKDPAIPMLHRFQVENQLDAMHSPNVQLKSGGYIVLNQTEALVAIDVNSGRATRERHIEETAYKTNLEAADEIARQLRLRDLAGLIVIDFIDMEESRNNHAVERRIKDAMRLDRARIQLGRISPFGLLELSRQRLRPSLMESSFQPCPHCGGAGSVRSVESSAIHILRVIEEEGIRRRGGEIRVTVHTQIALYLLNQKRMALADIETRYLMAVQVTGDDSLIPPTHRLERLKTETPPEILARQAQAPTPVHMESGLVEEPVDDETVEEEEAIEGAEAEEEADETSNGEPSRSEDHSQEGRHGGHHEEGEGGGRRRRRRRRRGRRDGNGPHSFDHAGSHEHEGTQSAAPAPVAPGNEPSGDEQPAMSAEGSGEGQDHGSASPAEGEGLPRRRRRGKRGGRRRNRNRENGQPNTPGETYGEASFAEGSEGEEFGDDTTPESTEAMSDEVRDSEASAASASREPERHEPPAPAPAEPAQPITPAPVAAAEPAPSAPAPKAKPAPEPEQPAAPPRRGWWNRVL